MKKITILKVSSIALILITSILVACSKDYETVEASENNLTNPLLSSTQRIISSKELSEDSDFIKLVDEMDSFAIYIKQTTDNNNLSLTDVQTELENLKNQKLTYDEQLNEINDIFETPVSEKLVSHMENFSIRWGILKDKYENLDEAILTDAFNQVFEKRDVSIGGMPGQGGCGWRYNVCLAATYAGAVLCHGACDTTALATTAGFGIPACVMACGTLQVYGVMQCYDTYCK